MASTEDVLTGLRAFLKRKGIDDAHLEDPVSIPFGKDPLMWWVVACEDGTVTAISKVLHQKVLLRNSSLDTVIGMRVQELQFRGKHVWRALKRQMDLYKKENKPNRALVSSVGSRYFGNLYEVPKWIALQKHCDQRMFVWILSDYYDDDARILADQIINATELEHI